MKSIGKMMGLCIVLTTISFLTFAQKCNYDYQGVDKISGVQSKGITFKVVKSWWALGFNQSGDKYWIGNSTVVSTNIREICQKGDSICFKLANNELIVIYANDNFIPSAQATAYGIYSQFRTKYNITKESLEKLSNSPLTYIRMNFGPMIFENEFSEKKGIKFQNTIKCILQPW